MIAREENPGTRGFSLRVGASIDLIRSCSGNILLAFAADDASEKMISRASALRKEPVGQASLAGRIKEIRARGYYLRESPVTRGVTDISFPIFGFGGELLAALTVPFLELIDGSQLVSIEEATTELKRASEDISIALGWRPFERGDE